MTRSPSEEWSDAQISVNHALSSLLNTLRDLGYNPNLHVSYDKSEHVLVVDGELLENHPEAQEAYKTYLATCQQRDEAVERIQAMPKTDLGF